MGVTLAQPLEVDSIHLDRGAHESPEEGLCLLEAVAYIAGQAHTDHPPCVSRLLGSFGRALNDELPDDKRQRLVSLVTLLPGTAGDGHDPERRLLAVNWLIHTCAPAWLRRAGLDEEAQQVQALPRFRDRLPSYHAREVLEAARRRATCCTTTTRHHGAREVAQGATEIVGTVVSAAGRSGMARSLGQEVRWIADAAARHAAGSAVRKNPVSGIFALMEAQQAVAPTRDLLRDSAIDLYFAMIDPGGGAAR